MLCLLLTVTRWFCRSRNCSVGWIRGLLVVRLGFGRWQPHYELRMRPKICICFIILQRENNPTRSWSDLWKVDSCICCPQSHARILSMQNGTFKFNTYIAMDSSSQHVIYLSFGRGFVAVERLWFVSWWEEAIAITKADDWPVFTTMKTIENYNLTENSTHHRNLYHKAFKEKVFTVSFNFISLVFCKTRSVIAGLKL